ncbi:alpha/beta hydrolase family esterase [Parabacteroides sp. FAFU027]|uniref:alpha/beta hydrolase family esterase n=1 Tax=Parabacteroides sp. FAFU027 TaxID=2922715 RepID=UPI001FAFF590|nr:PHB depolymerase family esterase [Parabacteroides sp. FAFU027]
MNKLNQPKVFLIKMVLMSVMCLNILFTYATNSVFDGTMSINVSGNNRTMVVHVPANIEENSPLMISLHGRWGNGAAQQQCARFESIADTARFIVVYPDGLPQAILGGGGNTGWDVSGATDDDITFFRAIINTMYDRYKINKSRVYLSGFSIGGMETYHAANVAAKTFAAFASVSGYPLNEYHRYYIGARPVPFMHIHGKYDGFVKVDSVPIVVDNWVIRNGCNPVPVVTDKLGVYTKSVYSAANSSFQYIYYALDGRGHEYTITDTFNPSKEIWNFVKRYTLNDVCDTTLKWNPNFQMQKEGIVPVGWTTFVDSRSVNGSNQIVTSGPRIITLGDGSDYQHGFLLQSGSQTGSLTYGFDKQRTLQLQPGRYKIKFRVIAYNSESVGKTLTMQLKNRNNNTDIYSLAVQPVNCIQNNVAKNFTLASYDVTIRNYGEYQLSFTLPAGFVEMMVADLGVYSFINDNTGVETTKIDTVSADELVDVYTVNGNMVSSKKSLSLSLRELKNGVYIVSSCERSYVTKVLK